MGNYLLMVGSLVVAVVSAAWFVIQCMPDVPVGGQCSCRCHYLADSGDESTGAR